MIDEFELLEPDNFTAPCESTQKQLDAVGSVRTYSLSNLKNRQGHCVWCDAELTGRRSRWCSDKCAHSALDYVAPHSPANKMRMLIFRQQCACALCGVSYEEMIRAKIKKDWKHWADYDSKYSKDGKIRRVSLHVLGYGTGDIWHVDHIMPLHKGGKGIDRNNLQVVCVECHKQKTVSERYG